MVLGRVSGWCEREGWEIYLMRGGRLDNPRVGILKRWILESIHLTEEMRVALIVMFIWRC